MTARQTQPAEAAPPNFKRGAARVWHQRRRHALVDRLVESMSGDALDYGCGWGDITHRVAPRFASIIGVDVSPDRVSFAAAEFAPIPFEICPAEGLRFPDQSFDSLLSIVVLPFVPDRGRYLAECRRVLRDGGRMLLAVPNPHSNLEVVRTLARRRRQTPSQLTRVQLESAVREGGFSIEAVDGFYDPPFDKITNAGEVALAMLNVGGHLIGNNYRYSYLGYRLVADG
ncbi:MAG TPA: class I SAM-dependent methyltransferase [Gemmatimonadales bacterium]|nr:class I SAM-dependent methyltransferase [Gemmatimonadales bacterium]